MSASVAVRQFPCGTWGVDYREPGSRKRIRKRIGTKRQAEQVAARLTTEMFRGTYFPESQRTQGTTFAELRDLWLRHAAHKKSLSDDEARFEHITKHFGPTARIDRVRPQDVLAFREWLESIPSRRERPFEPATINRVLALLRSAYGLALRERLVSENPVSGRQFREEDNERDRICTPAELARILEAAYPALRLAITLGHETGMRLSEITYLHWASPEAKLERHSEIDIDERLVRLARSKTGAGRDVPLSSIAVRALEEIRDSKHEAKKHTHKPKKAQRNILPSAKGALFSQTPATFSSRFAALAERLGIIDLHFHDLRHTAATNMRRAGVDVVTLKRIFGWKNWKTLERYQTVDREDLHAAVRRLEAKSESR